MKYLLLLVLAVNIYCIRASNDDLPSYMVPCDYNDKELEKCIRREIDRVHPEFVKGLLEFGVKPMEPFPLDNIIIDENNLKMTFFNPKLYGLGKVTLTDFKLDAREVEADFVMGFVGDMRVVAQYETKGKVLILPIEGNGTATINVYNMAVNIKGKARQVNDKENHRHLKLSSPTYTYDIKSTTFDFENLFNGHKQLSETTHQFANENWKTLMDQLAPPVIKQIATAVVKNINTFMDRVPLEKMIINSPVHVQL